MKLRLSLEVRLILFVSLTTAAAAALSLAILQLAAPGWLAYLAAAVAGVIFIVYAVHRFMRPVNRLISALNDGVTSFHDNDFSINIAVTRNDALGELVEHYNRVGNALREERRNLFQRELLLDTVIQSTPLALVLVGRGGQTVYSNAAARQFLNNGRPLEGEKLAALLERAPRGIREAVERDRDGLFSIEVEDRQEIYHLSQRDFRLNAQQHKLYLFKMLTRELARQEADIWKKVIRVISHEINNSLAPISSLAHSGQALSSDGKIRSIFAAIEERSVHLTTFISGYARFAKLPPPDPDFVDWSEFVTGLAATMSFRLSGELPDAPGYFDLAQIQQVMINLLKNAAESGSPPEAIELSIDQNGGGTRLRIADRGTGMGDAVLKNALLPFYSTKQDGTGLGLTLCREIVEAHEGRLTIANRTGDGVIVEIWLPGRAQVRAPVTDKL
ncbi:MAG TPA: ATP-binding protein [Gammaproteobacteria bacterium]|nr:ATP-binding protein [Gammaproteobacteria bacterium]